MSASLSAGRAAGVRRIARRIVCDVGSATAGGRERSHDQFGSRTEVFVAARRRRQVLVKVAT